MILSNEFALFLLIGLLILIYEAHRQFNQPAYVGPDGDEPELIYLLSPSEIRSRSAFFSAELFYIAVIVAVYLLLVFSDAFYNVVNYIVQTLASDGVAGGGNLPAAGGGALTGANPVPQATPGGSPLENAAVPYLVSVTMVVALKFPKVQQLEVLLRSFSQNLFGIPSIPKRLKERIEETPINLAQIESELGADPNRQSYGTRIDAYLASAQAMPEPIRDLEEFRSNLGRIAAYRLWVSDLHIWPSSEFRSDFRFFKTMNRPLLIDLDALFKDLDLLEDTDAVALPVAAQPEADGTPQQSMRVQLWELKIAQAKRLAQRVSQMMGLFDQNSSWPEIDKPGAKSLRAFLAAARSDDEMRTSQINLAIILLLISTVVAALSGYFHASWLLQIADQFGFVSRAPDGSTIPNSENVQFNTLRTARDFAMTSLIIYGLSMWVSLGFRRKWMRNGTWSNVFDQRGRVPPMTAIAGMFLFVGATVFAVYLVYSYGTSVNWAVLKAMDDQAWANFRLQVSWSIFFAAVGGFHGVAVAILMDLGRRQFENRTWIVLVLVYIAFMAGIGFLLGQFLSPIPGGASGPGLELFTAVRGMREILYVCYLSFVALLTSVAVIGFAWPIGSVKTPVPDAVGSPGQ